MLPFSFKNNENQFELNYFLYRKKNSHPSITHTVPRICAILPPLTNKSPKPHQLTTDSSLYLLRYTTIHTKKHPQPVARVVIGCVHTHTRERMQAGGHISSAVAITLDNLTHPLYRVCRPIPMMAVIRNQSLLSSSTTVHKSRL